jgi:quercetin dioxygenase-like cupin family protein
MEEKKCVSGVAHFFSDGLYAKMLLLEKGHEAVTHSHAYSHLSILAKGRVIVIVEDTETEYTAPTCIEIKAGTHHGIIALEDSTFFCIHATDETDIEHIDEVLIGGK